ncbi:hypothetical protein TanjilG_07470 [Lupinus angustifolius]|uniref:Uncharacterized protein n=1 Tax=Lupinus angustifolius TaxID=3871 RepID=A0A4P1QVF0_LUPAN|nr:PREDICTED: uncharacterized protein LOC109329551 [Lupinus angustifolius]OIV95314.1 hypothetical protein TanjilG_07470 [Lupinus angustifolius]
MDGEKRKRKIENEEENDEDKKMEKFFALVKSTKDVLDLLSKEKIMDKKVENDYEKAKGTWIPKFQPEDFIDYGEFRRSNVSITQHSSSSEREKEKEYFQGGGTSVAVAPEAETQVKEKAGSDNLNLNLCL